MVDLSRHERLAGLLAAAVETGSLPATGQQAAQARREHVEWACRAMAIEQGALEVLGRLSAAGVRVRLLKGAAVAHLDYPDPALRHFVDVDLLVPSAEFDRAVATLTAAGHTRRHLQPRPGFDRRFSKGTSFVSPEGLPVDLHRTFVMGPFGLRVDLDDLWGPGDAFTIGTTRVPALDPEARFLHACFHTALGDVPPRLVPQRDTAQMLLNGSLDLRRVGELMHRWRAEPVVAAALVHTWRTLPLADRPPLVEWALAYRPSARSRRELALYAHPDPDGSYARTSLGALRAVPGVRGKVAFGYALAFPERSYVEGRYRSPGQRLWRAVRAVVAPGRRPRAPG
ncbi:nucleotidyltransferase family protein [Blastococcus sp. SYSU D00868]